MFYVFKEYGKQQMEREFAVTDGEGESHGKAVQECACAISSPPPSLHDQTYVNSLNTN